MTKPLLLFALLALVGCNKCDPSPGHAYRVVRMTDGTVEKQLCERDGNEWSSANWTVADRAPANLTNELVNEAKAENATVTVANTVYQP